VRESVNSSLPVGRKTLQAHVICVREILFAYLCIFLIESACLFPAVWVR
jgi:hypothetical protein